MAIDMSAVSAPKRRTSAQTSTPRKATPVAETRSLREVRREGLDGIGQVAAGILVLTSNMADAGAVSQYWPGVSKELAELADTNETIAGVADFLTKTGPYTALIMAVLPLGLQIAANHRMVDAAALSSFGVIPPEVLEAQMKAEVMRQQAEALRAQQDLMAEMQEAEKQLAAARNTPTPETNESK